MGGGNKVAADAVLFLLRNTRKIGFAPMQFSFGHSKNERIEVEVFGYEREPVGEYYDDNWLTVEIRVWAGGFRGSTSASLLTHELNQFLPPLRSLYESLAGTAEFKTMEEQLGLRLSGDGQGHIALSGEIYDQPGIGNRLQFSLSLDQTLLAKSIRELEQVVAAFPERLT